MADQPTLRLLCGWIASGKSTLATELGHGPRTVVIREEDWLQALYGAELTSMRNYMRRAGQFREVVGPHVTDLLTAGVSVVLDFQANTVEARGWLRGLLMGTNAAHVLHLLDVPEEVCLERLSARNKEGLHPFAVTEDQFRQVSRHFVPPAPEEGFVIEVHFRNRGPSGPGPVSVRGQCPKGQAATRLPSVSRRTRRSATLTATNQAMAPRPKTAPIISPSGGRMVNERSKLTLVQRLILTRLSDGKAPRRAALI